MGLFKKSKENGAKLELDMTNILIMVIISLVLIQGFGLIFGQAIGIDVKLGPLFILIPLGIASLMGVAIVKKLIGGDFISREDIWAILVVFLIALLAMFLLEEFVPQIFSVQVENIQSFVGF